MADEGAQDHEAAAQEASEEAGVSGHIHKHPMGAYTYDKRLADDGIEHIRVMVYLLEVKKETSKWPEKDHREREWVSTKEAAERVDEDGLAKIIKQLDIGSRDASEPKKAEPALRLVLAGNLEQIGMTVYVRRLTKLGASAQTDCRH